VEVYELFKTNSKPNVVPIVKPKENLIIINRLSKVMTRKVNNAMEEVFKNFLK